MQTSQTPSPSLLTAAIHPSTLEPGFHKEYLNRCASLLLENEEHLLARHVYSHLLSQHPQHEDGIFGLGVCLYKLGDTASATKCFATLIELKPASMVARYWLGLGKIALHEDAIAASVLAQIDPAGLPSKTEEFTYHKEFGNCLSRLERFEDAALHYHRALQVIPQSEAILINLGTLNLQKNSLDQAEQYFNQALLQNTQSSRALSGLGMVYLQQGKDGLAWNTFVRALDADGSNRVALHELNYLSDQKGEYRELKEKLELSVSKEPEANDLRMMLASVLFKRGDYRNSTQQLDRILEQDPRLPDAIRLRNQIARLVIPLASDTLGR